MGDGAASPGWRGFISSRSFPGDLYPKRVLIAVPAPLTPRQEPFRINHFEAEREKSGSSDPKGADTSHLLLLLLLSPPLPACFVAARAKGRANRSNFPRMQGTIEPRMVFLVKTLPCSSSCSSPAHKGDAQAGTGRVLLQPPVPRCGGREERGRCSSSAPWAGDG